MRDDDPILALVARARPQAPEGFAERVLARRPQRRRWPLAAAAAVVALAAIALVVARPMSRLTLPAMPLLAQGKPPADHWATSPPEVSRLAAQLFSPCAQDGYRNPGLATAAANKRCVRASHALAYVADLVAAGVPEADINLRYQARYLPGPENRNGPTHGVPVSIVYRSTEACPACDLGRRAVLQQAARDNAGVQLFETSTKGGAEIWIDGHRFTDPCDRVWLDGWIAEAQAVLVAGESDGPAASWQDLPAVVDGLRAGHDAELLACLDGKPDLIGLNVTSTRGKTVVSMPLPGLGHTGISPQQACLLRAIDKMTVPPLPSGLVRLELGYFVGKVYPAEPSPWDDPLVEAQRALAPHETALGRCFRPGTSGELHVVIDRARRQPRVWLPRWQLKYMKNPPSVPCVDRELARVVAPTLPAHLGALEVTATFAAPP